MYKYSEPIFSDNKNLREKYPEINEYFNASHQEISTFPQENGLVVDEKYVNFIHCPVCSSKAHSSLFVKWGGEYVQCQLCSQVYVHNLLKPNILHDLYRHSMKNILERKKQNTAESQGYWKAIYDKYVPMLSVRENNTKILDIGAGSGSFLNYIKENTSFSRSCIELCTETHDYLSSLISSDGYFYDVPLEESNLPHNKFDIVTLWGVLEHIHNPLDTLQNAATVLTKDGTILVLVPNLFSAAFRILGVATPTINPCEHINFFTPKSMDYLAKQCGLKIMAMFGELPVIDLMHPYINNSEELVDSIMRNEESYYHVYLLKK